MSKEWLSSNWDKVLTIVIALVISGVVGFFTAIFTIKDDIDEIHQRLKAIETKLETVLTPNVQKLETVSNKIVQIEADIKKIRTQNDLAVQTNQLLQLKSDQERKDTLEILEKMIQEVKKGKP